MTTSSYRVRETILAIKPYIPGKPVDEVQRELGLDDVIKMASNENPLGPSPRAVAALTGTLREVHVYPDAGCTLLKQELARRLDLDPGQIVIGNGSDEVLRLVGQAFIREGDEAVIPAPTFAGYEFATLLVGGLPRRVPLVGATIDLEAVARAVSDRTAVVFLCNPNNPTGTAFDAGEFERFLDALPPRVLVVLDEAYREFTDEGVCPDSLAAVRQGRNLIVLRTFSKIYGLAALRVGYGLARPDLIALLWRVREPFSVNAPGQAAALAALEDTEHFEASRSLVQEGKEFLYRAFAGLGLHYVPTQANFVYVELGRPAQPVYGELLRRGVIIRPLDFFGLPDCIRVTVGTRGQNERFVAALREVLGQS